MSKQQVEDLRDALRDAQLRLYAIYSLINEQVDQKLIGSRQRYNWSAIMSAINEDAWAGSEDAKTVLDGRAGKHTKLQNRIGVLEAALHPFAHPDLAKKCGGNIEGDESPVFARDQAVLKLGHFRRAAELLK